MDGERTYMKFEKVVIKNFRNFDNVELDLSNKNIFFGLNDVGKTNFLYALRYVFDKDIRKQNLLDSDFHNKQLDKPIEIVVTIDISDVADSDCQKLRAQLKGALLSEHNKVYIKLFAEYSKTEMLALPILSWGGDINHLYEMKQRGYLYEIDYVFNVIYIDSYVDLYSLFKKNVSQLVRNEKDEDKDILAKIQNTVDDLNGHIASLSGIKEFEDKLTPEYQKFHDEGISVSIKSEIAVKGLYSNIIPYIKQDNDDNLYPTAGEGRKKLLAYSIYDILSDENAEKKINLFLIEEPENHLHIITTDYVLNLEPGKFIAVLDMKAEARNCLRVFFTFEDSRKVMATTQWWQRYLGFYEIPVGTHLLLHYRENSRKEVYLDEVERI